MMTETAFITALAGAPYLAGWLVALFFARRVLSVTIVFKNDKDGQNGS